MDFFEGLERRLGASGGFEWFRKRLLHHLGPYELMLRETCKRLYFERDDSDMDDLLLTNYALQDKCYRNGHVNILDYMMRNNWCLYHGDDAPKKTSHLSIVKWAERHPHLLKASDLLCYACKKGHFDIIDYGIERKLDISACFFWAEDIRVLDYLLLYRNVPINYRLPLHGVNTEEKLSWLLNYQHISDFSNIFNESPSFFIEYANRKKWTNTSLLEHVVDEYYLYGRRREEFRNWGYTGDCTKLSAAVAQSFPHFRCACNNPANHERRKRIKNF